jgi:(5-formylfuran-3-yl)methyl phosphate synthase
LRAPVDGFPAGVRIGVVRAMTALLASIASLDEARAIVDCVDVVDVKDPRAGALGALPVERVAEIVRCLDGRRIVSAALGEFVDGASVGDAAEAMAATGVDFVKVGLADPARGTAVLHAAAARAPGSRLVAVMFADRAPRLDALDEIANAGFAGAMLDTADKRSGTLLDCVAPPRLRAFVDHARARGLFVGLAGSLREEHLAQVLACQPDFVGLRGALCEDAIRTARISRAKTEAIAAAFDAAGADRSTASRRPLARTASATFRGRDKEHVSA